jgi:hypothetical protein
MHVLSLRWRGCFAGKIKQIRDVVPTIKEDKAIQLLHDNQYDVERAIDAAFESAASAGDDEWVESKTKKGKKKV